MEFIRTINAQNVTLKSFHLLYVLNNGIKGWYNAGTYILCGLTNVSTAVHWVQRLIGGLGRVRGSNSGKAALGSKQTYITSGFIFIPWNSSCAGGPANIIALSSICVSTSHQICTQNIIRRNRYNFYHNDISWTPRGLKSPETLETNSRKAIIEVLQFSN